MSFSQSQNHLQTDKLQENENLTATTDILELELTECESLLLSIEIYQAELLLTGASSEEFLESQEPCNCTIVALIHLNEAAVILQPIVHKCLALPQWVACQVVTQNDEEKRILSCRLLYLMFPVSA